MLIFKARSLRLAWLFTALFGSQGLVQAQERLVEDKTTNLQVGLLGAYFNHEVPLANKLALRLEIGLDAELYESSNIGVGFILAPVLTAEPRWYYNLSKRLAKDKRIDGNSGNFLALYISHHPNWFVLGSNQSIEVIPDLRVIPTWGIRRNIGQKFNFETGIGLGYIRYFEEGTQYDDSAAINLLLRFGYRIKN